MGKEYFALDERRYTYERDKDGAKMVRYEVVQETVLHEHEVKHQAT
jgi:hypothetical protein